jgi:hypothetical protein
MKAVDSVTHHHKDRHVAERFERMLGVVMVVAIAILAVGLVYGIVTTGGNTVPSWMR